MCGTLPSNVEKSKVYKFDCDAGTVGHFVKIVTGPNNKKFAFANVEVYAKYQVRLEKKSFDYAVKSPYYQRIADCQEK